MPILDTRKSPDNLWGIFVTDLVLQLLPFIAENERITIRQRQVEGIKIAKMKGVEFGRPKFKSSKEFVESIKKYKKKQLNISQILEKFNISKSTFYKYARGILQ